MLNNPLIVCCCFLNLSRCWFHFPSFFSAILFAWFFGFVLADITGLSMTGSLYEVDDYGRGEYINLKNLILPAITLGIRPLSVIVQLTRNSLLDVLQTDYMRTAIAKGLSKFVVLFKHGLRNALNPVVTAVSHDSESNDAANVNIFITSITTSAVQFSASAPFNGKVNFQIVSQD